ncbi:MAG TPA: STAS domain-containing protein [Mycobacteriales bacterium]|nr:STAS domain-containing protein [Mycobacteriales bacterium]
MPPRMRGESNSHDASVAGLPFGVEAYPTHQGVLLRVCGEVDVAAAPALQAAAQDALAGRPGQIHLHLGEVTFLDCAGLGVLIGLRNATSRINATAPRVTASRPVRRLMELTGVTHLFDLDPPTSSPHGDEGEP